MYSALSLQASYQPSYDDSQRNLTEEYHQYYHRQALPVPSYAPRKLEFAPSAPSINLYNPNSTPSSLPYYYEQFTETYQAIQQTHTYMPLSPQQYTRSLSPIIPVMNPPSPVIMQQLSTNHTQPIEPSQLTQQGRQGFDTATFAPALDQSEKKLSINSSSLSLL